MDQDPKKEPDSALALPDLVLAQAGRVLLFGPPGSGKTTMAASLARIMGEKEKILCLAADPGSPSFGAPGAVNLGRWDGNGWKLIHAEALCSLDAARFRLPLVSAVRRALGKAGDGKVVIDPPGVVRGVAGAELLESLVEASGAEAVIILKQKGEDVPLANELEGLDFKIRVVDHIPEAKLRSKKARDMARARLWDEYLKGAVEFAVPLSSVPALGTPPPKDVPSAWVGRQVALISRDGGTVSMGEAVSLSADGELTVRARPHSDDWRSILVRDACRDEKGYLKTKKDQALDRGRRMALGDMAPGSGLIPGHSPVYASRIGQAGAVLLNGLFGDPLLHVRLRDRKRSLLFDLGEATRLPGRIAHQVTDVFISHAHMDHIGGFFWLLRSRIGDFPPCRLYGPPGLASNIRGMLDGILWDRIGLRGPEFHVTEIMEGKAASFSMRAGVDGVLPLDSMATEDGVILKEKEFTIRAVTLDHKTLVAGYSFEQPATFNIRKEKLKQMGLASGPWLGELKLKLAQGRMEEIIAPPGMAPESVESLAAKLVIRAPGVKLAYITDIADTPKNREKAVSLARGADMLFMEAVFASRDKDQAGKTQHLTASACGQIARDAGVKRLAPFHFSKRYETQPQLILDEVKEFFPRTAI